MLRRVAQSSVCSLLVGGLSLSGALPLLAHNIEVAGDVAATFHIEPDHNPRAGEPALAWFALTQAGGKSVPLQQCDCTLKVFSKAPKSGDAPIQQPKLTPIAAEQYRDIPGAQITFPKAGQYTLELSGRPKAGAAYQSFTFRYEVTVLAGTQISPASKTPQEQPSPEAQATEPEVAPMWMVVLAGIFGFGIASALFLKKR